MKGIAPNIEKIGEMISEKSGGKMPPPNRSNKFGQGKKKKHLKFDFMKK